MLVELGICTGLLLVGEWLTRSAGAMSEKECDELVAKAQEEKEERDKAKAKEDAAREEEEMVKACLEKFELRLRLLDEPKRLTAESFIRSLNADAQKAVQDEVEAGTQTLVATKAYLHLARRKGGRHDS